MNGLYRAAQEGQRYFRKKKWKFCIIGGVAVARWGEPRATKDVDFSLFVGPGNERKIIDALLQQFEPRQPDAREIALAGRVVVCQAADGTPIDISLAWFPYEEQVLARASPFRFAPRVSLVTASAEDLVVMKAIADRTTDWVDIEGVLIRQGRSLQWEPILRDLAMLCELKEDPGPLERLQALRIKLNQEAEST